MSGSLARLAILPPSLSLSSSHGGRVLYKEWTASYEKLTDMIVPRSSVLVHEDAEYGLYSVTMFHKVVEEFKAKSREKKYTLSFLTPPPPSLSLSLSVSLLINQ